MHRPWNPFQQPSNMVTRVVASVHDAARPAYIRLEPGILSASGQEEVLLSRLRYLRKPGSEADDDLLYSPGGTGRHSCIDDDAHSISGAVE
ncbi:MAG TPA: hypothetical protein VGQ36_10175 [Thermoanaerobaculia bacterium]|jgi:hypothetical protein|nr:hypothetical protein [Thermoanaerobaculia bacterium]